MKEKQKKSISELRQDVVSGDWVVIATGRAKRPHDFLNEPRPPFRQPKQTCPFETLHADALIVHASDGLGRGSRWWTQVIPNKYPAFGIGVCGKRRWVGPYRWTEGVGAHEIVVTRDHERSFAQMSDEEADLVVRAYQERYIRLQNEKCSEYISIFHNHGRLSGATISHPHSQIVALPVIPPDVGRSLEGSVAYFQRHRSCVHCAVIRYELSVKERLVYENDTFLVIAPYASKTAFEMRIFPKAHCVHFADMDGAQLVGFANALRMALAKLYAGLKNPDYNFFLHTAPPGKRGEFSHYHWHMEILPKTAIWAGFEIGTGIEISTIAPEAAAAFLANVKI
ncbi:MAG: DUF4921 family protein [Candidatus Sungbacteria bacterium]|uniref:DUF4921 family protein n=1 Tax=Candidatus Sungiibacteriota bacterium TaxID=2750080 RepID=A0A932VR15_9BACT|nr:DUF4921 family protein [Candidatus Sungbacteria bacterium]